MNLLLPVLGLNDSITKVFARIKSLDIAESIAEGLDNSIKFVDEYGGPLSDCATIYEDTLKHDGEPYRHVRISVCFGQIMWLLSNIALRHTDSLAIHDAYEKMSSSEKKQFLKELAEKKTPEADYESELWDRNSQYQISIRMLNLVDAIKKRQLSEEELKELQSFDWSSMFASRVNSIYVYAMAFCLLHELSHHSLHQDFSSEATLEDEVCADYSAFWALFSDLEGAEKRTAIIGILVAVTSLIFVDPSLKDDKVHPLPVNRIFNFYDIVVADYPKAAGFLVHMFYAWAVYSNSDGMPQLDGSYEDTLEKIKGYMIEKQTIANCVEKDLN